MARFDAKDWLRQAARHRVEFSYLVPTMMHRIWGLPADARARYDLSALAGVIHTAAACPSWLKRAWLDWLGPERVWETYGSTEAVAATLISGSEWLERPGSVGRFFFGAMGQVTDDEGTPLPPGQVGLLWVRPAPDRGPGYDYVGATPPCRDGWHHFGDLGFMDSDGYVYLTDRRTDLIIRGGVNIYPAEIEAVLEAHPDVLAAAVIGLPDTDMGARLHAIVQVEPGSMPDLATFLLGRLSPGKHPASFEFVHTPLRDAAGKLSRGRLRQLRL
jgi:bile acid-coenzyme A ligase